MPASRFRWVYSVAHFGKSLLWHTSQILFAFFLTEACGLSPYAMGLVLTGTLLLNAAADLVVGKLMMQRVPSPGPMQRIQLSGAVLACLGLVLTALSATIADQPLYGLGIAGLALFAVAYAVVDVPQNALLGLAFKTHATRTAASSARQFLSGAAQLLVVLAFVPMMRGLAEDALAMRFLGFSLAISATAVLAALWLRMVAPPPDQQATEEPADAGRLAPLGLGVVLAMMALFTLTTASVVKLEPYIASYWFQSAGGGAAFMAAIAIGGMAAQPLWAWRARSRPHLATLREAALVLAVGGLSFHLSAIGPLAAFFSGLLYGAGQGGIAMLLWSLLAEISQSAPHRTTVSFGAFTFVAKVAGAASTLLLSHALAASGYRSADADLAQMVVLITLVPAVGAMGLIGLTYGRKLLPGRQSHAKGPAPDEPAGGPAPYAQPKATRHRHLASQKRRPANGPALPATHP